MFDLIGSKQSKDKIADVMPITPCTKMQHLGGILKSIFLRVRENFLVGFCSAPLRCQLTQAEV